MTDPPHQEHIELLRSYLDDEFPGGEEWMAALKSLEEQLAAAVKAQEGYYLENKELKRKLRKING